MIKREDAPVITIMILLVILFTLLLVNKAHGEQLNIYSSDGHCNLQALYDGFNEVAFYGELPKNAIVKYGTLPPDIMGITEIGADGRMHIVIDFQKNPEPKEAEITELHEMCHVKTWGKNLDPHGQQWLDCMHDLMAKGVFDDLL